MEIESGVVRMSATKADLQGSCHSLTESEVWLLLKKVSHFLAERNIESYVVGGMVRDTLLGRDTADTDIAVAADALEVASEVATAFGGKYVLLDKVNRTARVVLVAEEASSTQAQRKLDF
ncbi:MAG: hypothetical protein Q7K41_04655, partial [Dehalococcoidales bacterium]|nr:hypothetical protein [Dehalococcoidales bacterium]